MNQFGDTLLIHGTCLSYLVGNFISLWLSHALLHPTTGVAPVYLIYAMHLGFFGLEVSHLTQ